MSEQSTPHLNRADTAEWNHAWRGLGMVLLADGLGDGSDLEQEHDGEGWQYMGSEAAERGAVHGFRHRCHPVTGDRLYRRVRATEGWGT